MTVRGWIDRLVGPYAILLLREATGRSDPVPHLVPPRAAALPPAARVAFWSLTAGVGSSTLAALVAHRSTAARSLRCSSISTGAYLRWHSARASKVRPWRMRSCAPDGKPSS